MAPLCKTVNSILQDIDKNFNELDDLNDLIDDDATVQKVNDVNLKLFLPAEISHSLLMDENLTVSSIVTDQRTPQSKLDKKGTEVTPIRLDHMETHKENSYCAKADEIPSSEVSAVNRDCPVRSEKQPFCELPSVQITKPKWKENFNVLKSHQKDKVIEAFLSNSLIGKPCLSKLPLNKKYLIVDDLPTPPNPKYNRKDENDYGLDDLHSQDSTDDEDAPRKTRPFWALEPNLTLAITRMRPYDFAFVIFPPIRLSEIFDDANASIQTRTSSIDWHSFHRTMIEEQCVSDNPPGNCRIFPT